MEACLKSYACVHKRTGRVHARVYAKGEKMNHLILGAVFWVTGESGGTDGRLALAGTWPPAAGRNQRSPLLVWMLDKKWMPRACTHAHAAIHLKADEAP